MGQVEHIQVVPKTRDDIVQEMVELSDMKDRINFRMGEKVIELMDNDNNPATAKGTAGEVYKCTKRFVEQLVAVFDTFGWKLFYPDVPWSMYRACLGTDRPIYWLEKALQFEWSIRDLRREYNLEQGKPIDEEAAAVKFVLKTEGEVNLSPGLITVKADDVTTDNFQQGGQYLVDIRPK